jgi:iron complex transport system ATP-binding protein
MIRLHGLSGGYGGISIVKDIDLTVRHGEFMALLGPNGSGKSTIFKLITGLLPKKAGDIEIAGRSLDRYSAIELARILTVLTQEQPVPFDFTVEEIVMLGRFAHQRGLFKAVSAMDKLIVEEVMEITGVTRYRDTCFSFLSGGEKQRVLLAKALAQEPQILLLDEPTNHLDVRHTFEMLSLLKAWQRSRDLTVFAILHDLNVAALYADRIALLHEGRLVDVGDANVLRNERLLEETYQVKIGSQPHPAIAKPQIVHTPRHLTDSEFPRFHSSYRTEQNDRYIRIEFEAPLRTISNGVVGEGIQWIRRFFNFHVPKHYDCSNPQEDIRSWLKEMKEPAHETVGMMTAVNLKDAVFISDKSAPYLSLIMVTAGVGNAVDITAVSEPEEARKIGTINTMLFIDGHLTDGALINALMSATEAKTKALHDLRIHDAETDTPATGTSTDSLLIAATQRGEATPYAGSGTVLGKKIGHMVYRATKEAVEKYRTGLKGTNYV